MVIKRSTKNRLLILAAITLLAIAVAKATYGRFAAAQSVRKPGIKRVVKEGGWEIPGLKQSKIVEERRIFKGDGEKPATIYVTAFEPDQEIIVEVPLSYRLLEGGEVLEIGDWSIAVRSIARYDVDERVFCYFVRGVGALYDKKTGHGGYGGGFGLLYYDNDGDGKFESLEQGGHIPPFVPKVPKWVLK